VYGDGHAERYIPVLCMQTEMKAEDLKAEGNSGREKCRQTLLQEEMVRKKFR
jgi:hypothetical protein